MTWYIERHMVNDKSGWKARGSVECVACGAVRAEVTDAGEYLGIPDPVCCGIPEPEDGTYPDVQTCAELEFNGEYWGDEVTK